MSLVDGLWSENTDEDLKMKVKTELVCWIDKKGKIVSFHRLDDIEPQGFESREQMMECILRYVEQGYRIR